LLEHIGYYRLSRYWYSLLTSPKASHQFKEHASFNTAFKLYCFDRELRQFVLGEIEKIEVAVKAQMIHVLSHAHGPIWYFDQNKFNIHKDNHTTTLRKLLEDYHQSREDFVMAFRNNYSDPYPPSWIIMDVASFGRVSSLYKDLRGGRSKRAIADHFGLDDSTMASWLHCLVYLRNICAYQSRFLNREFGIALQIPHKPGKAWLVYTAGQMSRSRLQNNRAYVVLSIILYFLQTVNPKNTFVRKFRRLLEKYPNIDIKAMGFQPDW
jgi:abortive infection bacteriophage resistance protein